jgi:hypothetical protein
MWERSHLGEGEKNIGRRTRDGVRTICRAPAIFIFDLCVCVCVKKVVLYMYCIYQVCTNILEESEV